MTAGPEHELLRLKKWARRLGVAEDDIGDVAMDAYLRGLERGVPEWHFTSVCLKNIVLSRRRDARRRAAVSLSDEDVVELRRLSVKPTHELLAHFGQTSRFIEGLKQEYQDVLMLAAEEYSADEMAAKLGWPKKDVYWRMQRARQLMRDAGLYEVASKGSRYVGVRRDCHKWYASIRHGGRFHYLGSFSSPEAASRAYEEAALAIGRKVRRKKGTSDMAAA